MKFLKTLSIHLFFTLLVINSGCSDRKCYVTKYKVEYQSTGSTPSPVRGETWRTLTDKELAKLKKEVADHNKTVIGKLDKKQVSYGSFVVPCK